MVLPFKWKLFGRTLTYRKILKISFGAYTFKGVFKGLILGGAYLQREICISKSIGLALFLERNLPFFFVLLCIWGQFQAQAPRWGWGGAWAYIWRGDFMEGFLRYEFWGLIFGGAYFRNFTVSFRTWEKNYLFICWYFFFGHYRSESTKLAKVALCYLRRETRSHKGLNFSYSPVPCWSNEIQTAVNSIIREWLSVNFWLCIQILLKFTVDILYYRFPAEK